MRFAGLPGWVSSSLRRAFVGAGIPTTETVQRQIEGIVSNRGDVSSEELYSLILNTIPESEQRMVVDQAAQILVNRRRLQAMRNGAPVDPVSAGGLYTIRYAPVEDER